MSAWTDQPLLGFDTETTGVDPRRDRLVTAALVERAGGVTSARTWLVDPGIEIPEGAAQVHGITTEVARRDGRAPGEALEEIAEAIASRVSEGYVLTAFNAPFDLMLLESEVARHGLATLAARLGGPVRPVVDPLVIDRQVDRFRKGSGQRKLTVLAQIYGVSPAEGFHTAEVDVAVTLDVFQAILARYPQVAALGPLDLHDAQAGWHAAWAEDFERWLARKGRTEVISRSWPL